MIVVLLPILLILVTCIAYEEINSTVAVCVVAKGEELYLHEWIEYHLGIGFDIAFVIDNSEDVSLRQTLLSPESPSAKFYPDRLTLLSAPGVGRQLRTYQEFTEEYRKYDLWVAFIDADEFIVLHKHENIKQLLYETTKPFGFRGALSLNWVLFGSNGHKEYSSEPVVKRFTRRARDLNQHVKTIAYLPDIETAEHFRCPHHADLKDPYLRYDCDGNILNDAFNNNFKRKQSTAVVNELGESVYSDSVSDSMAVVHHYFTKSEAEYRVKMERGKADRRDKRRWDEFAEHDLNEVEDRSAWLRYCAIVGAERCF